MHVINHYRYGRDFERDFFGKLPKFRRWVRWVEYPKAIQECICCQNIILWDPVHPATKMSQAFYNSVSAGLTGSCACCGQPLELYDALGGPLDIHFGIDGFWKLGDAIVSFDLTLRAVQDKRDWRNLADVIVTSRDAEHNFERVGPFISRILLRRLKTA